MSKDDESNVVALYRALKDVEWAGDKDRASACCPYCGALWSPERRHASGCVVDAALKTARDVDAGDVLSPDYPIEEVKRELREAGYDPDEVGRQGEELVAKLKAERRTKLAELTALTQEFGGYDAELKKP